MNLHDIKTESQFKWFLEQSAKTVVVLDFYAKWCGPCKKFAPQYKKLADKNPDLLFGKINIEDEEIEELVNYLEITALPTFHVYAEQKLIGSFEGVDSPKLEKLINDGISRFQTRK